MASGTRGRLKEHLIGIHKNCEWIAKHVLDAEDLIKEMNPKIKGAFQSLGVIAEELDKFTQELYGKI